MTSDRTYGESALLTPANMLTASRLLVAPVFIYLIVFYRISWWTALVGFLAAMSDYFDGIVARRHGVELDGFRYEVTKEMSTDAPRRIARLRVTIWLPAIARTNTLAVTGTIWNVMAAFSTLVIGVLVYGEKVTPMAGLGFALALAAVLVLNLA